MINLTQSPTASPLIHTVPSDPGTSWTKDAAIAIDASPDNAVQPVPDAIWPVGALRTGVYGVVTPRVLALPGAGYRMYYTQILPRPGFPAGANDYDNSTTRILSAFSEDGATWRPEPGARLTSQQGGAGDFRVVSAEVVPTNNPGEMRMYFESCPGPQSGDSTIRSALSTDGGLEWSLEPGERLAAAGSNYMAARIVCLEDGRCRLYCTERGRGIVSGVAEDGLNFQLEPGLRLAPDGPRDAIVAFAPDIMRLPGDGYVMYYAGYSAPNRASILRAVSADGLQWQKDPIPAVAPGPGGWDAVKASEMCVIKLPSIVGEKPRYRIFYEACDGTAPGERGVWRIASATTTALPIVD